MTRVKNTPAKHSSDKKILKQAKGYYGFAHKSPTKAKEWRMRALVYAYAHRKKRKTFFRRIWISRLNSGLRDKYSLRYSQFIHLLDLMNNNGRNKKHQSGQNNGLNRKRLSEMLIKNLSQFSTLVEKVRTYAN